MSDDLINYEVPSEHLGEFDERAMTQANWHLRKIGEAEMERDTLQAVYRTEMKRLGDRLDAQVAIINRRIEWHMTPLKQWHAAILAIHPSRKTIRLPHGELHATVPAKPRIFIADMDAVQEWTLANHPDLCPPKRVLVTDLRNALVVGVDGDGFTVIDPASGEKVPGLTAQVPEPTFTIDTDPEAL